MRTPRLIFAACASLVLGASAPAETQPDATPSPWPEITCENKPWTRWWWPGSAVDKPNLTRQLEAFAQAGLGGVEITPIYGAKGCESRYISYLSPAWMDMLTFTAREAQSRGLGVDMATGTGWPFGGPWIDEAHALESVTLHNGRLVGVPTHMRVKRAAPGDEGLVVDPYSSAGIQEYLVPFGKAFAHFPPHLVRSQFHDSFEYYNASWTPEFRRVFKQMHGYDIQEHADELMGARPADADRVARLKSDYRDTLAALHLEYLHTWVEWSHQHGFLVRNQSHGAPGNLLDLYANADIAETEVFGSTPFPIPGLRRDSADVRQGQDLPETLVIRMASSAGHVVGHNLTSSETCTWLRDHWKVALAFAKPEIDRLFTNGINHIFYHGTVYSPADAPWPGWFFYASTQFNPNNTWWDDFGALNQYVARVQSILQRGQSDNDILLYWPIEDVWDNPAGLMLQLAVHDVKWLTEQPVGRLGKALIDQGYAFDFISDAQLMGTHVRAGALVTPGAAYKILIVPPTRRMPIATMRQLVELARAGASICFMSDPEDVPGLSDLDARRSELRQLTTAAHQFAGDKQQRVTFADTVSSTIIPTAALAAAGIAREPATETGLHVIRRRTADGHDYFFANLTARAVDQWVPLGTTTESALLLDPLDGTWGTAALRRRGNVDEVYLQLGAGQSVLLRCSTDGKRMKSLWPYRSEAGAPIELSGEWQITFVKGGPELPSAVSTTALRSWTELGGGAAERFGGTARYHLEFDGPRASAEDWMLDLGDVRESARVRLNGQNVGTAWSLPFQLRVGRYLKPGRNVLELEVTNLAANRIRDLDRRGVPWKIMREINIVNINYQPFDASGWPITSSGLLGPVRLVPLRVLDPLRP